MTTEESTLNREDLSPEARWSYYVTAYSMRDPTEGIKFSEMRIPFLKRNLPGKLDEDEEYDRFYRRLQHYDGLVIRICANNYTILYQPPTHDWFWRSNAPVPDRETLALADADAAKAQVKAKREDMVKDAAALKEKRHDRFVEKFVNNPNWAKGLSKDKVDESNLRFRDWLNGCLVKAGSVSPAPAATATATATATANENKDAETAPGADAEANADVSADATMEDDAGPETASIPVPEKKDEGEGQGEGKTDEKAEEPKVEPTDTEMADAEPAADADADADAATSAPAETAEPSTES
jgi:paired amphipathic helix protein Sin3a